MKVSSPPDPRGVTTQDMAPQSPSPRKGYLEKHEAIYVVFLSLLSAVPPLATDMYLGAIPVIAAQWRVPESVVGLSLTLWFAAFSVCLLVCGPLSDRFGRRPVLLGGLGAFVMASLLCSTAANVSQLILYRVLQGMGAAAPSSMCMAICRDRYEGDRRKRALAYIGTILAVAPMVAPSIGVTLLKASGWRLIFVTQFALTTITLLISLGFRETIAHKSEGSVLSAAGRYAALARNRRFVLANSAMGLMVGPHFGFIAFSPIAYMKVFGLSPRAFSLLFAFNSLMMMLGAFSCARLSARLSDVCMLTVCIIGAVVGTLGLLLVGGSHYLAFAGCMAVFIFCCGLSRPLSNHLILEQVDTDIGSASSMIVFYQFMVGAISMALATASWGNPVGAFGILAFSFPMTVLIVWPFLLRALRLQG